MHVLEADSVGVKFGNRVVLNAVSFTIQQGEQYAVTGPSGSGKTILLHAIAGRQFYTGTIRKGNGYERTVLVEQQHRFRNLSNTNTFYYQQRFNSSDAEDTVTVEEELRTGIPAGNESEMQAIAGMLHLQALLPVKLIQLSNGENKRLQIAKALLLHPAVLLLDKPFTGLDAEARETLVQLLKNIISKGVHVVLVTNAQQVPPFVTHVLELQENGGSRVRGVDAFRKAATAGANPFVPDEPLLAKLLVHDHTAAYTSIIKMNDVHVRYNNRVILEHIDWEVQSGEKWGLSGPNGSGKSTLLSLINADNPQAYANDIHLFGRKRGTGETIWEIKKKTGYVSPELHLYFDQAASCFEVVASGLFDTIGLFRRLSREQEGLVTDWMALLKVEHLRSKLLVRLSLSEQRLVLLARALVKDPPLLILDEPCQGLDDEQVNFFRSIIDEICTRHNKTLIYVSHYQHEIPACVNRFIRLENGRMV